MKISEAADWPDRICDHVEHFASAHAASWCSSGLPTAFLRRLASVHRIKVDLTPSTSPSPPFISSPPSSRGLAILSLLLFCETKGGSGDRLWTQGHREEQ